MTLCLNLCVNSSLCLLNCVFITSHVLICCQCLSLSLYSVSWSMFFSYSLSPCLWSLLIYIFEVSLFISGDKCLYECVLIHVSSKCLCVSPDLCLCVSLCALNAGNRTLGMTSCCDLIARWQPRNTVGIKSWALWKAITNLWNHLRSGGRQSEEPT